MTVLIPDCPDWLDAEDWKAYCEWRASLPKKQKMTAHAGKLILNQLAKLRAQGQNPTECLQQSIMNSWLGVFPIKRSGHAEQAPVHPAGAPALQVLGPLMTGDEKRASLERFRAQKGQLQ